MKAIPAIDANCSRTMVSDSAEVIPVNAIISSERAGKILAGANLDISGYTSIPVYITEIADVIALGGTGLLQTSTGDYISNGIPTKMFSNLAESILIEDHKNFENADDEIVHLDKDVIVACSPYAANYYHWHMNILSTVSIIQDSVGIDDKYILTTRLNGWQRTSLMSLGVSEDQIIETSGLRYAAPKFIYSSFLERPGSRKPPIATRLFDKIKAGLGIVDREDSPRKVYVSRSRSSARPMRNEADVMKAFEEAGYHIAWMEDLSYAQQVELIANADRVASPHGAGLTNVGFMKPGGTVLELCYARTRNMAFKSLAFINRLNYGLVMSFDVEPRLPNVAKNQIGWVADVDEVMKIERQL